MSFTLTADGSGLTNFTVGSPAQGNICTFGGSTIVPPFSCDSGTVSWTARTAASPAASEECKVATAAVDSASGELKMAKQKLRKAEKALKRAKTPSAKKKARSRLRKARARVRAAERAKKQAEQAAGPVCG